MRSRTAPVLALAGLVVLVAAGCSRDTPTSTPTTVPSASSPVSATASATRTTTPSPTPPATDPAIVFAADGIGPYVIGSPLTDLQARGLLTNIEENIMCSDSQVAQTTGAYSGKVNLTFRAGRLATIHTNSTAFVTPSGGKVGMSLTELQGIYGSRGTLINGTLGNKGYSVRVSATALAIVFFLDQTNTKVDAMGAGEAQAMEDAVRHGEGC